MAGLDKNLGSLAHAILSAQQSALPPPAPGQFPVNDGLWFHHKVVKLDGWHFVGCRFDNCKLVIDTPYFVLRNCFIDGSNLIEMQGALVNAVQFLNLTPGQALKQMFQPTRNPDGTYSVGG